MPVEIERKFLVEDDGWRMHAAPGQRICQGYLAQADGVTVRIRLAGSKAWVTIKGDGDGITRPEFEYPVPAEDAAAMLDTLCQRPPIEKVRHMVDHGGTTWAVDVFAGDNAGLVLAEVELDRPERPLDLPDWIGAEVTFDPRYRNANLAREPWRRFGHAKRPADRD